MFERLEIALELVEIAAHGVELGFGLREMRARKVRDRALNNSSPGLTCWPSRMATLRDLAGNVRRDQDFLRADIGIVGRDIAAARSDKCRGRSQPRAPASATSRIMRRRLRPMRANRPVQRLGVSVLASGDVLASGAGTIFKAFSLMTYPALRLVVDLHCARWLCAGCLSPR